MSKKTKKVNVNLGCGSHIIPGWINIDDYFIPGEQKDFVRANLLETFPLASGSVDYMIMDQVLEHIPAKDIPGVLFECKRVLKVGAKMVIIVPDFRGAAEQWLVHDHDQGFDPLTHKWFSEVIYGNQLHDGEYHKTAMSAGYLNYVLNLVGLTQKELIMYPAFTPIPKYEGMRPYADNAKCRNAQLVAVVTKTD